MLFSIRTKWVIFYAEELSKEVLLKSIQYLKNEAGRRGSYGVMAITLDFESNNPSSNLGRT